MIGRATLIGNWRGSRRSVLRGDQTVEASDGGLSGDRLARARQRTGGQAVSYYWADALVRGMNDWERPLSPHVLRSNASTVNLTSDFLEHGGDAVERQTGTIRRDRLLVSRCVDERSRRTFEDVVSIIEILTSSAPVRTAAGPPLRLELEPLWFGTRRDGRPSGEVA
jgi:hypothetical protein